MRHELITRLQSVRNTLTGNLSLIGKRKISENSNKGRVYKKMEEVHGMQDNKTDSSMIQKRRPIDLELV